MALSYRLVTAALLLFVAACSQLPARTGGTNHLTPQAFGTPQNDEIFDLASYSGGVYAVGKTGGSLYAASRGSSDAFITKIGSDKRTLWSRQFGTSGDDRVSRVVTDSSSNVYVFGSTTGDLTRPNRGGSDFFLRKYSASGRTLWTLQFGLETNDTPLDLVTTSKGVYVVGQSAGKGFFLYRYNFGGGTWWKRQLRTASSASSSPSFSLDSAGNVYVSGTTTNVPVPDLPGETGSDIRLEKFSGSGARLWTKVYNFSYEDYAAQIVAHGSSVFLLASVYEFRDDNSTYALYNFSGNGELNRSTYLGPDDSYDLQLSNDVRLDADGSGIYTDTLTDYYRTNDPDMPNERTLKRYRLDGTLVWERGGWTQVGTPTAVAERGTGEVYVGGYTGSAYNPDAPSDALLVKLSAATGATVWSK